MGNLPSDLRWEDFLRVLKRLGYILHKSKSGSSRTFIKGNKPVTFHQPHGGRPIPRGTLRSYIEKLGVEENEFLDNL